MVLGVRCRLEEVIWYDGDLFVIADIWSPDHRKGLEMDGLGHRYQRVYDAEKDALVKEVTGFTIYRRWNQWAMQKDLPLRLKAELGV